MSIEIGSSNLPHSSGVLCALKRKDFAACVGVPSRSSQTIENCPKFSFYSKAHNYLDTNGRRGYKPRQRGEMFCVF